MTHPPKRVERESKRQLNESHMGIKEINKESECDNRNGEACLILEAGSSSQQLHIALPPTLTIAGDV